MILDERVRAALAATTRFADIRILDQTDSTNRVTAELAAAGAPEGLVVVSDFQSAGRGRLDRTWEAGPGDGLLVSVLLRPAELAMDRWHLVTAAAALAAQDACRQAGGVETAIKWPNDLLVGFSKLAGILAEASLGAVVVGMGMNVHSGPAGAAILDREARRRVERGELLESWLVALEGWLGDWDRVGAAYRARCATVGRTVSVEMAGGTAVTAVAEAVDDAGRLVIRDSDGRRHVVAAGDVTHLR